MDLAAEPPIASVAELRALLPNMEEPRFNCIRFFRCNQLYRRREQLQNAREEANLILGPTAAMIWNDPETSGQRLPLLPQIEIDQFSLELRLYNPGNLGHLPLILMRLASALQNMPRGLENVGDMYLDCAIEVAEKASSLSTRNSQQWISSVLCSASMREVRYRRGVQDDLEPALRLASSAYQAIGVDNTHDRNYIDVLSLLIAINGHLYDNTQEVRFLDAGLRLSHKSSRAILETTEAGQRRFDLIISHSNLLAIKAIRGGGITCLDEAIQLGRESLARGAIERHVRAGLLLNVGRRYIDRFRISKRTNESDLVESLKYHHRAVKLCIPGSTDQQIYLNSLARVYMHRYDMFLDDADIEAAFRLAKEASGLPHRTPEGLATSLIQIAECLEKAAGITGKDYQLEFSIKRYEEAMCVRGATQRSRIIAAMSAGRLHLSRERTGDSRRDFVAALMFLENLGSEIVSLADLQYILSSVGGLSSVAAALTLKTNPDNIWESWMVLEKGRGSIINISIGRRSDLEELKEQNNEVYRQYMDLRTLLYEESPYTPIHMLDSAADEAGNDAIQGILKHLADKAMLARIESEWAILPSVQSYDKLQLQKLAKLGPIVALNATRIRTDAFIATSASIGVLELEGVEFDELEKYAALLTGPNGIIEGPESSRPDRNEKLRELLEWLWLKAVHPVLEKLEFLSPSSASNLPRIWWITSGLFGHFPFHAAGLRKSRTKNAFSCVLSSYVPTIQALAQARRRVSNMHSVEHNNLIVTMPQTVGHTALQASRDAEVIQAGLQSRAEANIEILETPSKAQIISRLGQANSVYFACHGEVDVNDPSNSGLLLGAGPDGLPERFTFQDLAKQDIRSARMACLLACSTARNEDEQLFDEMLHIVSGFQVAGFPHVIGALWAVDDDIASDIAGAFAERISQSDGSDTAIAKALHDAVNTVRLKGGILNRDVLGWAQFVHFGC